MNKQTTPGNAVSVPPPLARLASEELRSLVRDARVRYERKAFVIEGPHLVERALEESPKQIESAYFTHDAFEKHLALVSLLEKNRIELHSLSTRQAEQISDTRSPQGIIALVRIPKVKPSASSGVILLDGVQDPGNVGTIIRAAAWFGVERVILAHGSADPYAPKTVRATQGEIFSVACELTDSVGDMLARLKKEGHKVFTTTLSPDACSLYSEEFVDKFVLVLGSEAHGSGPQALVQADRQIMIPRIGSGESLNVAMSAAIILSEIAARKLRHT